MRDNSYICCNLSVTIFLSVHQPAMIHCRKLVQAYALVGMYQKKSQI
jgi:hypothetical protein